MVQAANNIVELEVEVTAKTPVTPMMAQFLTIKEAHPDYLLFYRMGDFYELFFEDALVASEALDIALTHRGKHLGKDVPMCGVPHHNSEHYLHKLIRKGFKVAICEQMEDPKEAKKRGSKAVVKREVVRIITPGTLTEDTLLDSRVSNYLAALSQQHGALALAWVDISTGGFHTSSITPKNLSAELSRINPQELLIPESLWENNEYFQKLGDWRAILTPYANSFFDSGKGERKLKAYYEVASLEAYGNFAKGELGASGALLEYLELTQKGKLPRLSPPKQHNTQHIMAIDASTRTNLELVRTTSGEYKGSLLSVIDKTVTGAGGRLLHSYLSTPLMEAGAINNRLDNIAFYIEQTDIRKAIREVLQSLPDMERALSRLYLRRGGPRDLTAIREGLQQVLEVSEILEFSKISGEVPANVKACKDALGNHDTLRNLLQSALKEAVGVHARDGNFITEGYHPKLDEYRQAQQDSRRLKEKLREQYCKETNIKSLKIKENNVIGCFIEVTPQYSDKVPDYFVHRQTLGSALRYTTPELKELEHRIINAKGYALELEIQLFEGLVEEVVKQAEAVTIAAQAMAGLDVATALAVLALEHNYIRPKVDNSSAFLVEAGRHPVVECMTEEDFIPNDCKLEDQQRLWLITGPNMAGKSTFLRQNALITIMAQMGSFVPADKAHIGTVDRVFSRVGASDNLARGQSTFMVEMVETAVILNHATKRSLVILDEIGRGTATYDGLSIAWAVIEHLHHKNCCRTLFATHYHELTTLASKLDSLSCHTVRVKEWKGKVIFMHEVVDGVADRSYGIHVGKLAGLPPSVLKRAEQVLYTLQQDKSHSSMAKLAEDLPLFASVACDTPDGFAEVGGSEVEQMLQEANLDDLTPRQALELLYELKGKANA